MEKKTEITTPLEVYDKEFNLAELGLIGLLLASPHIKEEKLKQWSEDEDFLMVYHDLMERGFIYLSNNEEGKQVTNIELNPNKNKNMNMENAKRKMMKTLGLDDHQIKEIVSMIEEVSASSYIRGYDDRRIEEEAPTADKELESGFTGYGKKEDFS